MASTPDPPKSPFGDQTPIDDRAARLVLEMEELRRKLADLMAESRELIIEMTEKDLPPADPT